MRPSRRRSSCSWSGARRAAARARRGGRRSRKLGSRPSSSLCRPRRCSKTPRKNFAQAVELRDTLLSRRGRLALESQNFAQPVQTKTYRLVTRSACDAWGEGRSQEGVSRRRRSSTGSTPSLTPTPRCSQTRRPLTSSRSARSASRSTSSTRRGRRCRGRGS